MPLHPKDKKDRVGGLLSEEVSFQPESVIRLLSPNELPFCQMKLRLWLKNICTNSNTLRLKLLGVSDHPFIFPDIFIAVAPHLVRLRGGLSANVPVYLRAHTPYVCRLWVFALF